MADFPDSTPMTEISRPVVEAEIELLIGLLDQLDEDPDLEDSADLEPSTGDEEPLHGALEQRTGSWGGLDHSVPSCFEGEELELGWTEMEARFGRYHGAFSDAYEPSLGSTTAINQVHWSKGENNDCELDNCDDEVGADREPDFDGEGTGNYMGACSPVETLIGGSNAK